MSKHILRSATFALNCQFPPKRSIKSHHQSFLFQFQNFESNHYAIISSIICIAKKITWNSMQITTKKKQSCTGFCTNPVECPFDLVFKNGIFLLISVLRPIFYLFTYLWHWILVFVTAKPPPTTKQNKSHLKPP